MRRAVLALLLLAAPAAAQQGDCADPQAQVALTFCAEQDWMRADAALNAAYKRAIARLRAQDADLPPELRGGEAALRQAQRAWVGFRDAACEAEGFEMRGGSGEAMLVYACRARLTDERAADLALILPDR